jgi:hypothetical protein
MNALAGKHPEAYSELKRIEALIAGNKDKNLRETLGATFLTLREEYSSMAYEHATGKQRFMSGLDLNVPGFRIKPLSEQHDQACPRISRAL